MISEESINKNSVCGVIVTYNGSETIIRTLSHLKMNVNSVIIVDNNSKDSTVSLVCNLNYKNVYILENEKNVGIAAALNIGARYAKELGYSWIMTMDQDSILNENVIEEMSSVYSDFDDETRIKIACLAPIPILQGETYRNTGTKFHKKDYVITSGNLVQISKLDLIGGYEEKLFIDSVDFDFCLKLGEMNFLIFQCTDAIMHHELGELKEVRFFSKKFRIHMHSGLRKYYISRNHIYMLKRFYKSNLKFCIKKSVSFLIFLMQILLFETDRKNSFHHIKKGISDGIKGKFVNEFKKKEEI